MLAPPPVIAKVILAITVKNNATLHSSLCELPPAHSAKEVWTTFPLIKARKHHYCCGDSSLRFHFNGVIQSTSLAPSKSWKACSKGVWWIYYQFHPRSAWDDSSRLLSQMVRASSLKQTVVFWSCVAHSKSCRLSKNCTVRTWLYQQVCFLLQQEVTSNHCSFCLVP